MRPLPGCFMDCTELSSCSLSILKLCAYSKGGIVCPPYTQSFGVKKSKAGFPYVILCPGSEHRALHKTAFFLHWPGLALYVFSTGTSRALREYIRCMHRAFPYFLPAFFKNITQFFLQSQCMFPLVPTVGKLCAYFVHTFKIYSYYPLINYNYTQFTQFYLISNKKSTDNMGKGFIQKLSEVSNDYKCQFQ